MGPTSEGVAARAAMTSTGEVMGGGGGKTIESTTAVPATEAAGNAPQDQQVAVWLQMGQEGLDTGVFENAIKSAAEGFKARDAAAAATTASSETSVPGTPASAETFAPGPEAATTTAPVPSAEVPADVAAVQARLRRGEDLSGPENRLLERYNAQQKQAKDLQAARDAFADGKELTSQQQMLLKKDEERRTNERVTNKKAEIDELKAKQKGDGKFDDKADQVKYDAHMAEKARTEKLMERAAAGETLTDAEKDAMEEGKKVFDLGGENEGGADITPEQRAKEMAALRDKAQKGELDDAGKERLLKLEDDEIEAVAAEYDPSNPNSLIETAEKLNDIAESRRGYAENKTMKETMSKVFREWVAERANPEANLSMAEKAALKRVQELVGGMHKDLLTIINANKQIEAVQRSVDRAIKATKQQEDKVSGLTDISRDSVVKQQEALVLQGMYVDLLNKKAQLLGAANAARYANNNFRLKRVQVRRSLGLTGFWGGLIESTAIRARNTVGDGVNSIDTFLNGKPLAERYINKGFRNVGQTQI